MDLERGTDLPHRQRRSLLWSVVFYAPGIVLPLASRLLIIVRQADDLGVVSAFKGAAFGAIQDAAVFLQTLVALRCVLVFSRRLTPIVAHAPVTRTVVRLVTLLLLCSLFAWLTLACVVDLALLVRFLPRLNRGFVVMYFQNASQFASSLDAVGTSDMALAFAAYMVTMALWVTAVLLNKVLLPRFCLFFCVTPSSTHDATKRTRRPSVLAQEAGLVPWVVHSITTSVAFRTAFIALLVFASAVHATLALDGNGNDIYLFSNAMFSLETENVLRASTQPQTSVTAALQHQHTFLHGKTNTTDDTVSSPSLTPFFERTIGRNEIFKKHPHHREHYPLWRKTVKYTGDKRFEWPPLNFNATKPPPTVILFNLESFRSREVGAIGGKDNVARYNQTVTPFFDSLAKTGVLFTQHYTPCVQTSRTLLSSLYGVLPSMKDASAISTFPETKFRLHGLPQILKQAFNYKSTFWSAVNLSWEDWQGFLRANGFDTLVDDVVVLDYLTKARRDGLTDDDAFSWGRHDPVSFDALTKYLRLHHRALRENPATEPLFLDVYSVSSHDPWKLPSSFKPSANYSSYLTTDNEKYVHSLNFVDQCLEKLFTTLRRKKLLDNTIILLEGDHGYGRMEHGNNPTIVASAVYDVGTHVPMLLLADDFLADADKGKVVDELTSQTDLLATVTDLLGIENFMQHGVGQSMLRKRDPKHSHPREVVLSNPFYGQSRGLRVGDLKYVRYGSGKYEVFNLTRDPLELAPVETGKLQKNSDGTVHFGSELNTTTAEALQFMEQAIEVASLLYETDGFMPSPDVTETNATRLDKDADARRDKILDVLYENRRKESGSSKAMETPV